MLLVLVVVKAHHDLLYYDTIRKKFKISQIFFIKYSTVAGQC